MKENILITGTNGYLQNHISHFLKKNDYNTNCISLRNNEWKKKNFKEFDTAIHLAGIVHQKKSINLKNYIDVNARLTYDFAKKCKADGIRHFIFFSTMSVYGENGSLNKIIAIKDKEKTNPNTNYGISTAAVRLSLAILNDARIELPVSNFREEYGVYLSYPAIVGREGILKQLQLDLPQEELDKLQYSADYIKKNLK